MILIYRFINTVHICFFILSAHFTKAQGFTHAEGVSNLDQITSMNGVAVADYDKDGDLDIFFTGAHSFDASDGTTWSRLMKNNGDGTFSDVTIEAGFGEQFVNLEQLTDTGIKLGVAWGDYDNDGYPDLYLTNRGGNQLYHNEGNGSFVDVTSMAAVQGCQTCFNASALWWDHDMDGDLDLYISVLDDENILYENQGDGTFEDVTDFWDLGGEGITWTSVALDIGKDGILDLYLANDTQVNQFFENRTGVFYNEASRAYRLADEGAGMGLAIGDYNNDGFFDIYVTNIFTHQPNPLFMNLGSRRFENRATEMGVDNAGWGWGTKFFDCDHDGDEDLYAVTGVAGNQFIDDVLQEDTENFFFRNTLMEETVGFVDWSLESGATGTIDASGRGLEVFDYDDDGDLDMVVANLTSPPYLFRNEIIGEIPKSSTNWIKIWLEGTESNRNAFGTEVKITIGDQSYYRWHHGGGFYGQSIQPVHFGLSGAEMIDEIQVTWPRGLVQTFENIAANRTIQIVEGSITTPVEDILIEKRSFQVVNQYPNPFHNSTTILFDLNKAGMMDIRIFSAFGIEVFRHRQQEHSIGTLEFSWDGIDQQGNALPSGVYFYTAVFDKYRLGGRFIKITGGR